MKEQDIFNAPESDDLKLCHSYALETLASAQRSSLFLASTLDPGTIFE